MTPTHMIYIDDSGNKDYAKPGQMYGSGGGPSRYFVFGGVFGTHQATAQLTEKIKRLKLFAFGTDQVEIKSHWIRRPEKMQEKYLAPYNLTEADLIVFVDAYYAAIVEADINLIAAVVDKQHMVEDYGERAYSPCAVAYEVLMQRVANTLGVAKGTCGVIIDDMTGRNPTGSPYKDLLIKQHENLRKNGSNLQKGLSMQCLGAQTFKDSAKSDMVQVADIVSFNVLRQFRQHGEEWEQDGLRTLPTYHYFKRVVGKFRQGVDGRIQGHGVVKMPLRKRVQWGIKTRAAP